MLLFDRVKEYHQLFNFSLWDLNRDKLWSSSPNPGNIFLFMLAVCLLAIALLGFGFYIWFFITSSEQSHVRLLNILNVYFSMVCIGGSVTAFGNLLASGLGYNDSTIQILVNFHLVAMIMALLLISLATLLKQFKPEVYLDLSMAWRHYVVLPTMLVFCISVDASIIYHCHNSLENECMRTTRRLLIIPAACINFILQSIVIIDDVWGFRNMIKLVITTNETPVNPFHDPAHGLQNHVVCTAVPKNAHLVFRNLFESSNWDL